MRCSGVPDSAGALFTYGVGVAAFHQLDAARCALVDRWGDEDVNVVVHDGEGMDEEPALVSIAEEGGDEEVGVRGALEVLRR